MSDSTYDPKPSSSHPFACFSSWLGGLVRARTPDYVRDAPKGLAVARVKGVVVERAHGYGKANGAIVGITLVVDDDDAATAVLDAIRDGTPIRVLATDSST